MFTLFGVDLPPRIPSADMTRKYAQRVIHSTPMHLQRTRKVLMTMLNVFTMYSTNPAALHCRNFVTRTAHCKGRRIRNPSLHPIPLRGRPKLQYSPRPTAWELAGDVTRQVGQHPCRTPLVPQHSLPTLWLPRARIAPPPPPGRTLVPLQTLSAA